MVRLVFIIPLVLIGAIILLSMISHLFITGITKVKNKNLVAIYNKVDFTEKELLSDISWYKGMLDGVHPSEIHEFPLGDIHRQIENLNSTISGSMTRVDFFKKLAPIVSSINDEHTTISLPAYELTQYRDNGGLFFPFDISFIDGRLYINANFSDNADIIPGMEILSINGVSSSVLRDSLKLFFSGSTDEQKIFYLQEHFAHALYIKYGACDRFPLELQNTASNKIDRITVQGQLKENTDLKPFSYARVDNDTMVFTYNIFKDPNNDFEKFLEDMFRTIQEEGIKKLVIDLRKNKGGDTFYGDMILSYLTDATFQQYSKIDILVSKEARKAFLAEAPRFIRWFPVQYFHPMLKPLWGDTFGNIVSISNKEKVPRGTASQFIGDLFVVIGPGSMSSATMLPSTVKKYHLGTLVGEDTGGKDTMYGNVTNYRFPNTGLEIEMPCGVVYGNTTGRIEPDYTVKQSVLDFAEKKDTVIEYIKEIVL